MKILNHPEATVDDLISASMYYEVNKKKIKAQRSFKNYKFHPSGVIFVRNVDSTHGTRS